MQPDEPYYVPRWYLGGGSVPHPGQWDKFVQTNHEGDYTKAPTPIQLYMEQMRRVPQPWTTTSQWYAKSMYALGPMAHAVPQIESIANRVTIAQARTQQGYKIAKEWGSSDFVAGLTGLTVAGAYELGPGSVSDSITGKDMLTGRELSETESIRRFDAGVFQWGMSAVTGAQGLEALEGVALQGTGDRGDSVARQRTVEVSGLRRLDLSCPTPVPAESQVACSVLKNSRGCVMS
jgi:hypothetical protein